MSDCAKDCRFEPRDEGGWRCAVCGYIYRRPSAKPPRRNCRGSESPAAIAAASPIGDSGHPDLRDEAEVARLRLICTVCDRWDASAPGCRQDCAGRRATRHAARLLRGDCPLGRWA